MAKTSPGEVSLPRVSKGKRPQFFDDPSIEQIMTVLLELMAETSALRDRVDTIERLLDANGSVSRADIEAYRADDAVELVMHGAILIDVAGDHRDRIESFLEPRNALGGRASRARSQAHCDSGRVCRLCG